MGYPGGQSPQVPKYEGTVFISYARADDEKFPLEPSSKGWVSFFWEMLRWALTNAGLQQANLWLDRYQIEPAEEFTQKIEAALKEARLIVPIISPNWVQRPWCLKELERFCEFKGTRAWGQSQHCPSPQEGPAGGRYPPAATEPGGIPLFRKRP